MNTMNLSNKSTWHPGRRPSRTLEAGVRFTFNGETFTFVEWAGTAVPGAQAVYRTARVASSNGMTAVRLNMAGSVGLA